MNKTDLNKEEFSILAELLSQERPNDIVPLPFTNKGENVECRMILLLSHEQEKIEFSAHKVAMQKSKSLGEQSPEYNTFYNNQLGYELIAESCRRIDDMEKKIFPSAEWVKNLTRDQIGVLINHYTNLQRTKGPIISNMTQEEIDALMMRMMKEGTKASFFLNFLSSEAIASLIDFMASQLRNLPIYKSSSGELLKDTTENQTNTEA